jgi:hypothetical protein
LTLLLYILFPLLCILAVPKAPARRPGSFALRLVLGIALYEFLLFFIGTALGLSHHLTTRAYSALTWCTAFVLLLQAWRNGIRLEPPTVSRWLRTRRGAALFMSAALIGLAFALELIFDGLYGTSHNDGLWYHIPRMMFWLQQQGFEAWPTPVWQQVGLPVGADVVLGQNVLLGNGWRGIGYVTFMLSAGAMACVYLAALEFRLSRWQAAMTAILFGSFPGIGLRIWAVNSDMAAAFPALASFVLLYRVRDTKLGFALFIVLNGLAVACKPTVAPLALLLDAVALWQCRRGLLQLRSPALPLAALILGCSIMSASFWPVYAAFSDVLGGDGGRGIKVSSATEFTYAVVMSAGHWALEPLGYLSPVMEDRVKEVAKVVYNGLGAGVRELPLSWKPWPAQDLGRTGLATFLLLPALLIGLNPGARLPATLLFVSGFFLASGMIRYDSYNARYIVVLLAGYAMLWGCTGFFRRGRGRWVLGGLVALNAGALLGVVSLRFYVDQTVTLKPGGAHHYVSEQDRGQIASTLAGRPLQVVTNESLDALLVGPRIEFPLSYLGCPSDGDWARQMREAAKTSNWLAVVHGGKESFLAGPTWHRPSFHACPEEVSKQRLEDALAGAGWQIYRHDSIVDLWQVSRDGLPSPPENQP